MPGPTLTPEQIAQLKADKTAKQESIKVRISSIAAKEAQVAKLTVSDSAFKSFFDYYNSDIIAKYELERKAIDGQYIANPITEADIVGPATVNGSVRTTPTMPETNILRVDEFDGGPLVQEEFFYEQKHINSQELVEGYLVNGFEFTGSLSGTAITTTPLLTSSTSLGISDIGSTSINEGDTFAVYGDGTVAVVKAVGVTNTTPPPGPPTIPPTPPGPSTFTIDIEFIINPVGTISSGSSMLVFSGFNNIERTNKDASNNNIQGIMDALIVMLNEQLTDRDDRMTEQLNALNANQDPNQTDITAAKNDIQLSKSFIDSYVVGMDISDTGLLSLSNNRSDRSSFLTTRLSQIEASAASFYDPRYDMANNRGNTSRGTLRLQKATESTLNTIDDFIESAQAQIDAIDELLGL